MSTPGTPELEWTKSSYSGNEHGSDCVEVAEADDIVLIRDSKHPQGPALAVAPAQWADFIAYAVGGGGTSTPR